jgi:signal transduction histidine kinase
MYVLPSFCGSQPAENGRLLVSVTDTGVGLPNGKTDQIFNAFFTTKPQGTGPGLAIARSIVESTGGRFWATASSERETTFHFTLSLYLRSDWMTFLAASESYFAPDECMSDPMV